MSRFAGGARIALIVVAALLAAAPSASGQSRVEIARAALGQQGVKESKRNCNPYGPCQEWCASFATWVWQKAGVAGVPRNIHRARGLGLWGIEKGLFKARPAGTDGDPEVGDWVIWGTPSAAGAGHVDIVTRVANGTIDVVGGNVDNKVTLRTIDPATKTVNRDGSRLGISGYVTPPGLGSTPPGQPAGTTPGSFDGVVAVSRAENQLDVFVRGGDFALMHRNYNGRAWGPWVSLGGKLDSEPAAVVTAGGRRIDVVARGQNGAMSQNTWMAERGWSGWRDTGGVRITSSPTLTSRVDGTLDAFALTGDNVVSHRYMYTGGRWSRWVSLGREGSSGPAAIASNGAARLNVLVRDIDGSMLSRMWTKDHGWYSWVDRGGSIVGRPTVTTRNKASYALDVFTRGAPKLDLQHWYSKDGASWLKPVSLGGALFATPSATSWAPNRLDVFSRNNENQLVERSWSVANGGWSPYVGLGTTPAPPVTPAPQQRVTPPRPPDAVDPDSPPARGAVRKAQRWTAGSSYQALTNLDGRRAPRLNDRAVSDHVRAGQWVRIECQTTGELAYGSRIWDRVGGLYVPDRFIRTHTDGFLRGAPRCKGAAAKPPPPRKPVTRAACDQVREDQEVKIDFVQRYTRHAYDRTQVPSQDIWRVPDKIVPMGSLSIGAATCKAAGRWRVMSPLAIDYSSTGLDENANPKGEGEIEGLGITLAAGRGPHATRDGYLEIDAVACNRGRLFSLAGQLADNVAPRLISKVSKPVLKTLLKAVYKLARNQLPEDKVKCRLFSKYRIPIYVSPSGKLGAYAESIEYRPLVYEQQAPGGNPNLVDQTMWASETH